MVLKPAELARRLRGGKIDPVYVFAGDAVYRTAEAAHFVLEEIQRHKGSAPDKHVFALSDRDKGVMQQILTACNTFSMFGATQAVIVEDVPLPKLPEALTEYCASPSPATVLILRGQPKPVKRRETKALEAFGTVVVFEEPREGDMLRAVVQRARKAGIELGQEEAHLLVDRVGNDLGLIQRELERVALTIHPRTRVGVDELERLLVDSREFSVFDLLDPLSRRDRGATLRAVQALLEAGAEPLSILFVLASGLRDIWTVRAARSPEELRKALPRPDFVIRRLSEQAARFSEAELPRIWRRLWETDCALKSSRVPRDELLFALIMDCIG